MRRVLFEGERDHNFTGNDRFTIDGFDFGFCRTYNTNMPSGVVVLPDADLSNPDYIAALTKAQGMWLDVIRICEAIWDAHYAQRDSGWRYRVQGEIAIAAELASRLGLELPPDIVSFIEGMPYAIPSPAINEPRGSYVYLLKYSTGVHKIGRTNRPALRLTQIRNANPDIQIDRVCLISTPDMIALERTLHQKYRAVRVEGERELFNLSSEDVDYIKGLADASIKDAA